MSGYIRQQWVLIRAWEVGDLRITTPADQLASAIRMKALARAKKYGYLKEPVILKIRPADHGGVGFEMVDGSQRRAA